MKQALLITAYKNIHHLKHIIDYFGADFSFYIHIDKKSSVSESDLKALKESKSNVFISRQFKTNWGGMNHLNCTLLLLKEALSNNENEYIHLISGHDFPIKTPDYFSSFLQKNKGKQFIEYFTMPAKVWENGGMDRLLYYNFYDPINAKVNNGKNEKLIRSLVRFQKNLGLKRSLDFNGFNLYGGSTWWSLNSDCCNYIINFTEENPAFLKRFKHTFCAEEIFFQTIIMNSRFKDAVINNNLRHIIWELRNGNMPAALDESDFDSLMNSQHLFARRFDYPVSEKIVNYLIQQKGIVAK